MMAHRGLGLVDQTQADQTLPDQTQVDRTMVLVEPITEAVRTILMGITNPETVALAIATKGAEMGMEELDGVVRPRVGHGVVLAADATIVSPKIQSCHKRNRDIPFLQSEKVL
jgi:hypothetical protein